MTRRDLPNLITALRIMLVIPIAVLVLRSEYGAALVLFVIAGVSDAVDGYLARTYNWATPLGGWLDPIADKAMMVASFLALGWQQLIPVWLVAAVILRDVVIVSGGWVYYSWVEKVEAAPSAISKINTFMQILLVFVVIFSQAVARAPEPAVEVLFYLVLVTTVLSGIDYVWSWGLRALRRKKGG